MHVSELPNAPDPVLVLASRKSFDVLSEWKAWVEEWRGGQVGDVIFLMLGNKCDDEEK
jgi:hypothetical protein